MTTDICGADRFSPGVTVCTYLNEQTIIDPLWEMLLLRVDFSSVGKNCVMEFGNRWMCFQAGITDGRLWMFVRTVLLPWGKRTGAVGFPCASPEGVALLHGIYKTGSCGGAAILCSISDWVTSLQPSLGTCTGLVAAAFAFWIPVGDDTWRSTSAWTYGRTNFMTWAVPFQT